MKEGRAKTKPSKIKLFLFSSYIRENNIRNIISNFQKHLKVMIKKVERKREREGGKKFLSNNAQCRSHFLHLFFFTYNLFCEK
jgi:hypothetical protein